MASKRELQVFLEEISQAAQFANFNYISPEDYKVLIKCKVTDGKPADYYNTYCKEWINKFSTFTNTAWIVRTCYPSMKRIVFRKTYCCHRAAQNKAKNSTARNVYCKAKIDFKTKFINKYTVRNDTYLLKGLNMTITVQFEHSHLVRDFASFTMLKSSSETDALFYQYFADGHSPATARSYHELRLIGRHGRDSAALASAGCNPSARHVAYLYRKRWDHSIADVRRIMHRKIHAAEKLGHTVKHNDCRQFVIVLTATMKRAIAHVPLEQLLVDETPMASGLTVVYLYVPSAIGSLPVASVVYHQKDSIFREIFLTIKLTIESECNTSFAPKLVLLGEIGEKKEALTAIFPGVVVKKNRYILCRELWEWLCDEKNVINRTQWHATMASFKSLIYATSEDSGSIICDKLMLKLLEPSLSKVDEIWTRREEWLLGVVVTGGFSDAPVAFMKECLAQRCRSFDMCAMLDVITDILERQYKKIILAHEDGKVIGEYTKMLPQIQFNTYPDLLRKIGDSEYLLQCKVNKKRFFHLNTDTMFCDCETGVKGGVCEHLCGVLNVVNDDFVKLSSLPEDIKNIFLKVVDEDVAMKSEHEDETDLEEADENDESMWAKASEDCCLEIKTEVEEDPLDSRVGEVGGDASGANMTLEYEAAMRGLNEEFRRLNRLFRDNPNPYNLETMRRLARELSKIRSVESVDVSAVMVTVNRTDS